MHKLKFTFVACTLLLRAAFCQGQTFTKSIQIHFETGKYVLTREHKKAIGVFLDSIPKSDSDADVQIQRIVVNGNTENEGNSDYNLNLSEKRAEGVISYLGEKGMDVNLTRMNYYGETKPVAPNDDPLAKSQNRRVDIGITYTIIKKGENLAADSRGPCDHDTVITLASGGRVSMSICDYERMGGDFQVNAVVGGPSVRESGLNTMGDDGTPLMSGGMFDIKFKNDSCLKKPVTIRIPVDTCIKQPKKMRRYVYNYNNGHWSPSRARVHVVKVGKQQFYEFSVQCPGKINLDYPQNFAYTDKRKFYAKNGLTLVDLRISDDCPCSLLDGRIAAGGKRAYAWVSANQPEPYVSARAIDKNGDTLNMHFKPLSSLLTKGKKQVTGHILWVFPIRKTIYHDKYCLRRADFDVPTTAAK